MSNHEDSNPNKGEEFPQASTVQKVTRILTAIGEGGKYSTDDLIPLVYTELRKLAAYKLGIEKTGQTLQPTALVHEAYLRLVEPDVNSWKNQRQFFGVAAEAMRRILIENKRRKNAAKRGGDRQRTLAEVDEIAAPIQSVNILDVNDALEELCTVDEEAGEMVKLRYFVGLTIPQIAKTMGISPRKADRLWAYSKAWLYRKIKSE
ncbi:MAG: ECF-type sigma factor [Puniceicoccaceae bacterium]